MTNHSHRLGLSVEVDGCRTGQMLPNSLQQFRRMIESAREQRPKRTRGSLLPEVRTWREPKYKPDGMGSSLRTFRFFLSRRGDFPQQEARYQVNTLGGNYSVLLIHPEDFTSSDGKTTLGVAICTQITKISDLAEFFRNWPW